MEEGGFTQEELESIQTSNRKTRRIMNWVFGIGIVAQCGFWYYLWNH